MENRTKLLIPTLGMLLLGAIIAPILVYRSCNNPQISGPIGDTIGGIAGPIVNLCAAILVYYSFKQQYLANQIQLNQINEQKSESHDFQLYQLIINELKESEVKFNRFSYLDKSGKIAFEDFLKKLDKNHNKEITIIPNETCANELRTIFTNLEFVLKQIYKFQNKDSIYYDVVIDKLLHISVNYFSDYLNTVDRNSGFGNSNHFNLYISHLLYVNNYIFEIKINKKKFNT